MGYQMFKIINFISSKFKKKEPYRTIPPHVSLRIQCHRTKAVGFTGFDLKRTDVSVTETVVCPACKHAYSIRIKPTDTVGSIIRLGSKHIVTITAINKTFTTRDF